MTRLKNLWNKFKKLPWWQKLLLALPFILLLIFVIITVFLPDSEHKKFNDAVQYHKEHVDEQLEKKKKLDKLLAKRDRRHQEVQERLEQEIKGNEEKAANIIRRIDNAANNDDFDELERIQSELNATSQNRKF
jgi:flagellar biosynthesis/type III secretory pathway M-ring protein FliF/YscJ